MKDRIIRRNFGIKLIASMKTVWRQLPYAGCCHLAVDVFWKLAQEPGEILPAIKGMIKLSFSIMPAHS